MSTSIWGDPEPHGNESHGNDYYPVALLRYFLQQMIQQCGAQGGCIALYDESIRQMRIQLHLRMSSPLSFVADNFEHRSQNNHHVTLHPLNDKHSSPFQVLPPLPRTPSQSLRTSEDEFEEVTGEQSELFAVGTCYPSGRDLIGYTWQKNESYVMRHEDYLAVFHGGTLPFHVDSTPTSYLTVPIRATTLIDELQGRKGQNELLGVAILYQLASNNLNHSNLHTQRAAAQGYAERVALYLENDRLQRAQERSSEYLQLLQNISTAFPTSVKLSDLVEYIYQFASHVVDVSSMLLTLYDRDHKRLYDVFAIRDGQRTAGLAEQPVVRLPEERPVWWNVTQNVRTTLLFSPAQDTQKASKYQELLSGVWGDQRSSESFILIPMKMFTRVIGALCLTSSHAHAYQLQEIQVLETMVQIVTVSIENAKLYERDRALLQFASQREEQLAAINNALQSIGAVLSVTEVLNNLVESIARLLRVDICAFFQPSADGTHLIAHTLYAPSSVRMYDDGSGLPVLPTPKKDAPDKIINLIQLPFKGTLMEQLVNNGGFFYLDPPKLEELALRSNEEGAIFLREINTQNMLVIPVYYQEEFIGVLSVPTPRDQRTFRPKLVTTLLAICAQAASAIRNAQLFEQREVAYAELERMSILKDEFLVTASHELRTPLTAISGYSSQLRRQSARANPQQIQRFAAKIAVATQQLIDLVSSMTDAVNIGADDKPVELELTPVQVLSAAEISVSMLTFKSEQNVMLDIPATLWIRGDAPRVRQVLTNLLENAAKYSPLESSVHVFAESIKLSDVEPLLSEDQIDHALLIEKGDIPVVLVRVRDKGEGILPEDQQRIFEKFVRAPRSLTTTVRGSGLGLYICRRYVEAMGGKLWLEQSTPNEGSTFSFYLLQVQAPEGAE